MAAEGNLGTIYGIERVPCDTHMQEILDPVSPEALVRCFKSAIRHFQQNKSAQTNGQVFQSIPSRIWKARGHGVFFLQDDSLCVMSTQGPPQRAR